MARVSLTLNDSYVYDMNDLLTKINDGRQHNLSPNDLTREALGVYMWVLRETAAGRAVVSANRDLDSLTQMATTHIPARDPTV